MKTFNYPQSKWVMTGALLIALGFTVSFNKSSQLGGSMDFSSTEKTADMLADESLMQAKTATLKTGKGDIPVRYIDGGKDRVLAIVPLRMTTAGAACHTCGYEMVPLVDIKNKDDLTALNDKLKEAYQKKLTDKAVEAAAEKKTEKVAEATSEKATTVAVEEKPKEKEKEKEEVDHFARIEKRCGKLEKNSLEMLNCKKDEFLAILSDKKLSKDISPSEALAYYKAEINSGILKQMSEMRKIRNREMRASMGSSSLLNLRMEESFESPEQILEEVSSVLSSVIADTNGKFESVRKQAITAQSDILKAQAAQYKQVVEKIDNNKDLQYDPRTLWVERQYRANDFDNAYRLLMPSSREAINTAYMNDNISDELQTQYERYFSQFNTSIQKALFAQGDGLNGVTVPENFDLAARLAAQRGSLSSGSVLNKGVTINNGRVVLKNPAVQLNNRGTVNRTGSQINFPRLPQ